MYKFESVFVNLLEISFRYASSISDIVRRYDTLNHRAPKEFTKTYKGYTSSPPIIGFYHLLVLS